MTKASRASTHVLVLFAAALTAACTSAGADGAESASAAAVVVKDLGEPVAKGRVPQDEISGLAMAPSGEWISVSDSSYEIAFGPTTADYSAQRTVDLEPLFRTAGAYRKRGPQWEGIAVDTSGRMFLLEENPGTIFVVSADASKLERTITLDVDLGRRAEEWQRDLKKQWDDDPNSRGEGLVLLPSGHVLILKEYAPRAIIEFGPAGESPIGHAATRQPRANFVLPREATSSFVPLQIWKFDEEGRDLLPDASELTEDEEGRLYVLSDQGRAIVRIASDLPPDASDRVEIDKAWKLPRRVEKPEGLLVYNAGFLVAVDGDADKKSVFRFDR